MTLNCWEIKNCGREPGGVKIDHMGVCPAALPTQHDGMNNGSYGGRFCWTVKGTLCDNKHQNDLSEKLIKCVTCEVYLRIKKEEEENFVMMALR